MRRSKKAPPARNTRAAARPKRPAHKTAARKTAARAASPADLTVSLPQFLVDGTDLAFREFIADLYAAVSGMRSLRSALARSVGLSAAEFSIVLATWYLQRRGAVGIQSIARHLHVASPHVTAEVGKLVDKGLVKKLPNPRDARGVVIRLTAAGTRVLTRLVPLLRRINDRLFSGGPPADVAAVSRFLRQLAAESANSARMAQSFAAEAKPKG